MLVEKLIELAGKVSDWLFERHFYDRSYRLSFIIWFLAFCAIAIGSCVHSAHAQGWTPAAPILVPTATPQQANPAPKHWLTEHLDYNRGKVCLNNSYGELKDIPGWAKVKWLRITNFEMGKGQPIFAYSHLVLVAPHQDSNGSSHDGAELCHDLSDLAVNGGVATQMEVLDDGFAPLYGVIVVPLQDTDEKVFGGPFRWDAIWWSR